MTGDVALVRSPLAAAYDFGSEHPMRAARAELAVELAQSLGVLSRPTWRNVKSSPADLIQLRLVHDDFYVGLVQAAERAPATILAAYRLGTEDTPVFPGIHDAACAVVGGTLAAVQEVWSGRTLHAVSLVGGLHHAMRDSASGFCVYNDVAVGIADLLASGCTGIAYLDLDAHHGDGVEAAFAADPRVLTISLHQDGRTIFPGTGGSDDVGAAGAEGYAVNVPLPMGTGDRGWLPGRAAPVRLGDLDRPPGWQPWDAGDGDPDDPLDWAVSATRRAVLPLHGLDPLVDR